MKYLKLAIIASVLAATASFTGCTGYDTDYKGPGVSVEPSHNALGIATTRPDSYRYVDPASTLIIRTEDLWCRRDYSGDNVSLLWGLINVCDY